jgi:4-carboxymuconolactone decarboxylase
MAKRSNKAAFEKGLEIRNRVMGEAYTERAFASADPHDRAVQELVTEWGYGKFWSRAGLPIENRSMITIALLAALNRPEELRQHIRGALRVGLSCDQVFEVLLHVMLYCGAPASLAALKVAKLAYADYEAERDGK